MAITSTQSQHPASVANIAVGSYLDTGTVAAFKITTGFQPRYVKVVNETGGHFEEWFEGMEDAEALKCTEDAGTVDIAMITSNGITVAADGFTVGLDTDIHVTSEQLSWIAIG